MEIINFADRPSLVSRYMRELRDVNIQNDPLRFRSNLRRIGQIMAYEISKRLDYSDVEVQTPLGPCVCQEPADKLVIATILRAGLPFHEGFLSYFDRAENAFVSAYRKYREKGDSFQRHAGQHPYGIGDSLAGRRGLCVGTFPSGAYHGVVRRNRPRNQCTQLHSAGARRRGRPRLWRKKLIREWF